jgi:tetratricopeptide (TPR) repeat protein
MKKLSIILLFSAFGLSCGSDNSNQNNVTTPTATPTVAANNNANQDTTANANIANANVKKDEPVPAFTDAPTAFAEGNKYFDANETEKAIEAFKQAVKLNPDLAEAHFKLGVAYALIEKEKEEQVELQPTNTNQATPTPKVIKKGKGKNQIVITETDSFKAFSEAVKAYKKIIAKNPKDDAAHFNLGRSYNKLNDDKEAEKALRQAVKLKPDDSEYQTELGSILIKFAKYEEAVAALKKALKLDETNSQAQDLLDIAEAGKKRIDFGVEKAKQKAAAEPKGNR